VRDPAKWVDNCPECLNCNNTPLVVEVGTRPGSIRCHYQCRECRGTWRTEYVAAERRTGKTVLPFDLEEDMRAAFGNVDPSTGEILGD